MIKSLLGEDENTENKEKETPENKANKGGSEILPVSEEIKTQEAVKTENTVVDTPEDEIETIDEIKTAIETGKVPPRPTPQDPPPTVKPFEVDKPIGQPIIEREIKENEDQIQAEVEGIEEENNSRALELEKKLREIEEELKREKELELERQKRKLNEKLETEQQKITPVEPQDAAEQGTLQTNSEVKAITPVNQNTWDNEDWSKEKQDKGTIEITPKDFNPVSKAEGIRQMGMAWSAGIAFFISVIFMLILGWGADLLLGTEPWGIVVGIVIGAIIGFIQLIRTTSQIFKKDKPNDFDKVSLKSNFETVETKKVEENIVVVEEKTETKNEAEAIEPKSNNSPLENDLPDDIAADDAETVAKADS